MTTAASYAQTRGNETQRPFSLRLYLLIVFALSWPFQIAYALWGNTPVSSYLLRTCVKITSVF